ncbi:hypothetical protein RB213_012195 [Colletotrichum asianum]
MAAMSRLLGAVTVMAFTVISSTAIPFTGKPVDPNCGVICSNLERPYDGAVCYETKREDGTCQPVWVNAAMLSTRGDGLKDVNHMAPDAHYHNTAPFAGNLPIINDREDAGNENSLAKRLQFDLAPKPQRVCEYVGPTCMDPSRGKGANAGDCEDLIRFWYNNHGKWTIQKRDLEGRHYLELAQSGSCLYAVGHPHLSVQANDTVVGNSDIWATLAQGFNECGTNGKMEVQGMLDCDDWNLFFWIGSKDKFECCKGEHPPNA